MDNFVYSFLLIALVILSSLLINDIGDATYSYIGDEFAFYELAKGISESNIFDYSLLSQKGVYSYHPMLDSIYQGTVMKLFGKNLFGWKLSVIIVVIFSILLVFLIGTVIFENRLIALASSIFYGFSHYLLAYAHIGYNNLNALIPFLLAVLSYLTYLKKSSRLSIFLSGVFSGFSFYTFYSARLVLLLIIPFLLSKPKRIDKRPILEFLVGFLLIFLPFFIYNKYSVFSNMIKHPAISEQSFSNFNFLGVKYFFLGLFIDNPSFMHHFFTGPLLSFIFAIFFIVGIFLMITFEKKWIMLFFLSYWFFILAFVIIIVYTKLEVPLTRLHIVLPSVALVAGYGLVKSIKLPIIIVFILSIYISYQLYYFYREIPKIYPTHRLSLIIKLAKENQNKMLCTLCAKSENDFYHSCGEVSYLAEMFDIKNIRNFTADQIPVDLKSCDGVAAIKQDDDLKSNSSLVHLIKGKTGMRYYDKAWTTYIYYYQ